MTVEQWLECSNRPDVQENIRTDGTLDDYQALIAFSAQIKILDWPAAVALLHMVYGWMPRMLRAIDIYAAPERSAVIEQLRKARDGVALSVEDMQLVKRFSNRSTVGASKLLHILNPHYYAIWDSRVARVFLADAFTQANLGDVNYLHKYTETLRSWTKDSRVLQRCGELRQLHPALRESTFLRMLELPLYVFDKIGLDRCHLVFA